MTTPFIHFMTAMGTWMQANPGTAALLIAGFLATLANTLGRYPKAAGVVGYLRKAVDLVSIFAHNASPGTMKMPVVTVARKPDGSFGLAWSLSAPPPLPAETKPEPDAVPAKATDGGFVRIGALVILGALALALGAALFGCANASPMQKAQTAAFLACLEAKGIGAATGTVENDAIKDLTSGLNKDVIVGQLEGLAGQAGMDATICAVQAWLNPGTKARRAALSAEGVAAAEAFLAKHGVKTGNKKKSVAIAVSGAATFNLTSDSTWITSGSTAVTYASPSTDKPATAAEIAQTPNGRCPACWRKHDKSAVYRDQMAFVTISTFYYSTKSPAHWDENGIFHPEETYAPKPSFSYRCSKGHYWSQDHAMSERVTTGLSPSVAAQVVESILSQSSPPSELPERIDVLPLPQ